MAAIEVERTLVKSPPELWEELHHIESWLSEATVTGATAPARLEWSRKDATGVVELTASGWGTRIRATATMKGLPWDRVQARQRVESELRLLLDKLGSSSLKKQ